MKTKVAVSTSLVRKLGRLSLEARKTHKGRSPDHAKRQAKVRTQAPSETKRIQQWKRQPHHREKPHELSRENLVPMQRNNQKQASGMAGYCSRVSLATARNQG